MLHVPRRRNGPSEISEPDRSEKSARMIADPGHCRTNIAAAVRVVNFRREAVADIHTDDAMSCEIAADIGIYFGAAIAVAFGEGATMDEHDGGAVFARIGRRVDIQPLTHDADHRQLRVFLDAGLGRSASCTRVNSSIMRRTLAEVAAPQRGPISAIKARNCEGIAHPIGSFRRRGLAHPTISCQIFDGESGRS